MERYDCFWYSMTGLCGFYFRDGNRNLVMRINIPVVPSPPACLIGRDFCWVSGFDDERTIVPGMTRAVVDEKTEQLIGELEFRATDRYLLRTAGILLNVFVIGQEFLVSREGVPVACSWRADPDDSDTIEVDGIESKKRFSIEIIEESLPAQCKALILAFPALRLF